MIERLQRALAHVEQLSPEAQEELAEHIEQYIEPPTVPIGSLAGSMPDLPDEDEFEVFERMRHETQPSPPMEEQLGTIGDVDTLIAATVPEHG
jgi:hypothetical protein